MGNGSLSGFFLDVEDLFASITFRRMSFAEKGVYLVMLCEEWRQQSQSLPDDASAVADLISISDSQAQEVAAAWPAVRRKFVADQRRGRSGRIFNVRLEQTRRQQAQSRAKRAAAGAKGGNSRSANGRRLEDLSPSNATATLSTDEAKPSVVLGRVGIEAGNELKAESGVGRSRRPIFSGQRLTVFDWMLDDCMKTLGDEQGDAFDLHRWFFDIDAKAVHDGLVIPKRDGGAWLQSQLVSEAQRRGLQLRMATTASTLGKANTRLAAAVANIRAAEGS